MDKRAELAAQAPWHQPENITGMAEEVADECPASEALIAKYEYDSCVDRFKWKLPDDDGRAFCTCYGERFAGAYVEYPLSSFPSMGRIGAAALYTCSQEISPNPLH